jgi:integrase
LATKHLTDAFIRGANSGDAAQVEYFDSQVKGLSIRITSKGKKVWSLFYTSPATGKRRRMKLGEYVYPNGMSLSAARAKAVIERGNIGEGKDPAQVKVDAAAAASREQTVQSLIDDYLQRYVAVRRLRSGDQTAARLARNVSPLIGGIKLSALHRRDIVRVVNEVVGRGSLTEANRTFDNLRAMVRWAVGQGILDSNIMDAMARPAKSNTRDRVLSGDEIQKILRGHSSLRTSSNVLDIIELLFATACRAAEIGELERNEVDLEAGLIRLPGRRVKNGRDFDIPITEKAEKVLRRALARNTGKWVFPNKENSGGTDSGVIGRAINRMRDRIDVQDFTAHDIRRSWATMAAELGVAPHVIAAALNHVSVNSGVTFASYLKHDYMKERRQAHALVESRIHALMAGTDNIVPISKAQL